MTHESNGIDIITALILNDISPLCKYRMDLVLQLKVGPGGAHAGWAGETWVVYVCVCVCARVRMRSRAKWVLSTRDTMLCWE